MFNSNDPFWPYAKHTQEVEDIIDALANAAPGHYTIDIDDDFSDEDLAYIKAQVEERRNR